MLYDVLQPGGIHVQSIESKICWPAMRQCVESAVVFGELETWLLAQAMVLCGLLTLNTTVNVVRLVCDTVARVKTRTKTCPHRCNLTWRCRSSVALQHKTKVIVNVQDKTIARDIFAPIEICTEETRNFDIYQTFD